MAAQRCLDAIAATPRVSGRDDAAPLDLAAPASDLRAARYVGDRPRHGRAAWHVTSAAREPMLRPDAVFSAAAPPARVDVSRPLDPLRCSHLSHHVMLFLCFARFIRLLFLFRRPVPPFCFTSPSHCIWLPKIVLTSAVNRCYPLPSLRDDAARRRARRAALQHCSILLLQTSQVDHSGARDAARCDANAGLPEHARRSADAPQNSLKAVATKPAVEDAAQR